MARCRSATWVQGRLFGPIPACPGGSTSFECPSIEGLAGDLRQLAEAAEGVADIEQETKAVGADRSVVGQHEHVFEEAIEERAQLRGGFDRAAEVACVERRRDLGVYALERFGHLGL